MANKEKTNEMPLAARKKRRTLTGVNRLKMEHSLVTNAGHKDSVSSKRRIMANTTLSSNKDDNSFGEVVSPVKKRKKADPHMKQKSNTPKSVPNDRDAYCWLCHRDGKVIKCAACPRVFHLRCLAMESDLKDDWVCAECERAVRGENVDTRSSAMRKITVDELCVLLKFAVNRMKHHGDEAFLKPVSTEEFPNYTEYVFQPMDLTTLEKNIRKKIYGSTESFLSDAKWILHNCIIFNGYQHRLTTSAKTILKVCKFEMNEIEVCPNCYLNSYTNRDNWFCEPCREPHPLIWAKLKGFPYWPAKAMKVINNNVDVRFFGAHDRAWIPLPQCFLLCRDIPTAMKNKKKGSFEQSMEELANHIQKLRDRFGLFQYAPFRAPLNPQDLSSHIATFLPQRDKRLTDTPVLIPQSKKARLLDRTTRTSPTKQAIESADGSKESCAALSALTSLKSIDSLSPQDLSISQPIALKARNRMGGTPRSGSYAGTRSTSRTTENKDSSSQSSAIEGNKSVAEGLSIVELKIPKLKLHSLPKTRLDSTKKLESTIERLKESATEKSDDELSSAAPLIDSPNLEQTIDRQGTESLSGDGDDVTGSENDESGIEGPEKLSQLCEVTSTTTVADAAVAESDSSQSITASPLKKGSSFVQKLDQTIESCKAKLGIDDIAEESLPIEESSDDEKQDGSESVVNGANVDGKDGRMENQVEPPVTISLVDNNSPTVSERSEAILMVDSEKVTSEGSLIVGTDNAKSVICNDLDMECSDDGDLVIDLNRDSTTEESDAADKFKGVSQTSNVGGASGERRLRRSRSRAMSGESSTSRQTTGVSGRASSQTSPVNQKGPVTVINISSPHPRPSLTPKTVAQMAPPSSPGPGCDMNKYSRKMMDFMRGTVEEMFRDMAKNGNLEASVKTLQLEIEKLQWRHQQELAEIKHNTDLILLEMRASMESEKQRSISEVRRQCEIEKQKAVEEAKMKQWCANCSKEAIFYCCWNTSYCDYPCQQAHWPQHMSTCAQSQGGGENEAQETPMTLPTITTSNSNSAMATNKHSSVSLSNQVQRAVQQGTSDMAVAANRREEDTWPRKVHDEAAITYKRQQEEHREREKQRQLTIQPMVSQANSLPTHYQTSLGPSVQYIPSNAVQVIPQTSSLATSSGLQVQYVTNLSPNTTRTTVSMGTASPFTSMTAAPAFPVQNMTNSPLTQRTTLSQVPQRAIQMSNSMYPIVIQSAAAHLGQNTNSQSPHSYPRGPYIPGKPYHLS